MNAREYLNVALGGNMNTMSLKPLAIIEIMEAYADHVSKQIIVTDNLATKEK